MDAPLRVSFDRGTLAVHGAADIASALSGVRWDPRTGGHRLPPWKYAELVTELERRALPFRDDVAARWRTAREAWAPVELRPYQQAALSAWELAGKRGLVALPTGSGKTRVALAAMALGARPTLCVVPTRVLLHQWREEIGRFFSGAIGCWGDGERRREAVTVITYESAYRHMSELGGGFELLVVDEAHHFGCGLRDEALEMSAAPLRFGLSATPPDGMAAARLADLIGPTVYQLGVADLTGRYLADFDHVVMHLRLDPDERARYQAEMGVYRPAFKEFLRGSPTGRWSDFVAFAAKSREGRAALASWRRARAIVALPRAKLAAVDMLLHEHRERRVLIFTSDNESAYAIARRHLAMPFTCDIGRAEREEALGLFRDGKLRALVSARVLNEGLDVPDADVAIIAGGSLGEREHVQRVGRLLRPAPGKRALVYELVAAGTSETRSASRRGRGLCRATLER